MRATQKCYSPVGNRFEFLNRSSVFPNRLMIDSIIDLGGSCGTALQWDVIGCRGRSNITLHTMKINATVNNINLIQVIIIA